MASAVAELDSLLTSMLELAPPGVSKTKITSITALCSANIQSESVLIQKVYTHFKKAPANKKLGVLYVVDSVTRQWIDQAKKAGQAMGASAADGTFAAGANHVTELLPALMQDIIAAAPEDQKTKIKKLIDIWERGNTFPTDMVTGFKDKLSAPAPNAPQSTTPIGSPRQNSNPIAAPGMAPPAQDTSAILANLQALANKTNGNATGLAGSTSQASSNNVSYPQTAFAQQNVPPVNAAAAVPPSYPGVGALPAANNGMYPYGNGQAAAPNFGFPVAGQQQQQQPPPVQMQPQNPGGMMPGQNGAAGMPDGLQQQLQILAALKAQGIPENQWPALLSVLMNNTAAQAAIMGNAPDPNSTGGGMGQGHADTSRDRNGGFNNNGGSNNQYVRSPPGRRDRSRSRSPDRWNRRRDNSPRGGGRRRDSPVYGEYSGNKANERGGGDPHDRRGRGGRGRDRQRSPPRRRSNSPQERDPNLPAPGPRRIDRDPNLPKGHIKVHSRTLFVGGVTRNDETALRSIFQAFGRVQTCIISAEKRHAFIKMISREEAVRAKEGMENFRHPDMQLRTRWGVGFGPRDCSDYQTGISVIPIDRLTDADRKWLLTADFGGTGGKAIEGGMCVEEPDIEIGAGVSSKAISRRMQTDKSGMHGPRSTRDGAEGFGGPSGGGGGGGGGGGHFRERGRRGGGGGGGDHNGPPKGGISSANSAPLGPGPGSGGANAGTPPQVPSFNFNFGGLPQGFPMPGQPGNPGA